MGSSQEEGTLATGGLCEVSKVGRVHPRDRARPVWLGGGRGEGMLERSEGGARNRSQWVFRAILRREIYESELIERGHY